MAGFELDEAEEWDHIGDAEAPIPEESRPAHAADRVVSAAGLTLRANFLWTLTGTVVYAACQWGMLVALAKLGTPEIVGEFALALAITAPVIIGASLGLRSVQATDSFGEYPFADYLVLRLLTTVTAIGVVTGIIHFSGYGWRLGAIVFVIGLAKGIEAISDIVYGLLQRFERMDRIACSMMMKGPLQLAALAGGVYFGGGLFPGVCALVVVWATMLLTFDIPNGVSVLRNVRWPKNGEPETFRLRWNPRALGALAWLAAPVGIVMALMSLNANVPRYFVGSLLGTRELGIFAALAYPMVAGGLVVGAMGQSALPRLARHYALGERRAFWRLLAQLQGVTLAMGALGIAVIAFAGKPLLGLLYRAEYAAYADVFLCLAFGAVVGNAASLFGYGMTAARHFRSQIPVFCGVIVATLAGCMALVPRHGLMGAAIAVGLASLCQALGSATVIWYAIRKS